MMDLVGQTLGNYEIIELIGQGGMASVYRARQTNLTRFVAIKVLAGMQARDQIFRQRFIREAKAVAQLSHPHIIPIYDFGDDTERGILYIVMELITGGSLRDYKDQQIPPGMAIPALVPIAQALAYAHTRGIVHRDIKPNNILINADGRPILSDFGLAQLGEGSLYTEAGTTVGTPAYMAPEQVMGEKLDGRADIYSLAMVLYELLAGRTAFQADTPLALLHQQVYEQPPSPRQFNSKLPRSLEAVLLRALAKDRSERHRTAEEFAAELQKTTFEGSGDVTPLVRIPALGQFAGASRNIAAAAKKPATLRERLKQAQRTFTRSIQRAMGWTIRTTIRLALILLIVLLIVVVAGTLIAANVAERTAAEYAWNWNQFKFDQPTVFQETALQDEVDHYIQALNLRDGVLPVFRVHVKPREIIQIEVNSALGVYYVDTRVFVVSEAAQARIETVNGYTLYIVRDIISDGLNRGLGRAFENGPVKLDKVESSDSQLIAYAKPRHPTSTPPVNNAAPTATTAPTLIPSPTTPPTLVPTATRPPDTPTPTLAPTLTATPALTTTAAVTTTTIITPTLTITATPTR
jgi:serine/threonine-protein kinase